MKMLVRLFVKDADNPDNPTVRYAYGKLAGMTGIISNLLLFLFKMAVGSLAASVAIVADAFNNLSDAGSSVVTLLSFRLSGKPADEDHPFGHGRMEYLSTMAVAVLILIAGFELASSAFDKILNPTASHPDTITIVVLVAAIAVKLWLALFNRRIGQRIHSDTLLAASVDSRNDVLCTALVLVSAVISYFTDWMIDGYVGLAIALFVMWSGFAIIRDTLSPLLGQKPDEKLVADIKETVLAYDGVVGIHDLIVHDYGPGRIIASLHAEVPASQDILISHDIVDCIENELMRRYNIVSCIHMDPVDTDDPETIRLQALTSELLSTVDERLTMHDFRVVAGHTHTNLLFDVIVPYDYPARNTLAAQIDAALKQHDERLNAVIKIENAYA